MNFQKSQFNSVKMFYVRWIFAQLAILLIVGFVVDRLGLIHYPSYLRRLSNNNYTLVFSLVPLLWAALAIAQKWALKKYSKFKFDGWIVATITGAVTSVIWVLLLIMLLNRIIPGTVKTSYYLMIALFMPLTLFPMLAQTVIVSRYLKKSSFGYAFIAIIVSYVLTINFLRVPIADLSTVWNMIYCLFGTAYFLIDIFKDNDEARREHYNGSS